MDLTAAPQYFQPPPVFVSNGEPALETRTSTSFYVKVKENPFADSFQDPLCKLNLKETSEFVKSFPMANSSAECRGFLEVSAPRRIEGVSSVTQRRLEAPPTPGRPVFSFSVGNLAKKSFPSKWDNAEKWLISSSCHASPAHVIKPSPESSKIHKQCDSFKQQIEVFAEKSRVTEEIAPKIFTSFQGSVALDQHSSAAAFNGASVSADMLLKDKFTSEVEPVLPNLIGNNSIDISQLQECHLAKLHLGTQYGSVTSNWSSREEEEEEISKSLRHFETGIVSQKSVSDSRAAAWEEEEKTKYCLRYQREEAKIQAWLNLESAKAEAQSRKLEVKIQKMRSNLEEKLMKRMVVVQRKAEEWRAAAHHQHTDQIQRASVQAQKIIMNRHNMQFSGHTSCGCLPCNNNH
ncbi:hypothetical protein OIU77_023526 [Salix suchowensis]|uniref:Remorin C-terminal domain-containing protein n=1 Tax=Salix suchowensis TaxID=1278906 RepID=A0ABQ9C8E7_9ROSI|nr:hypothetical protein OIU78_010331 [Salix suchowensis]KAJ6394316.1 hypothetical protein OIU77_023526 [Salix suchowensis]